MTTSKKPTAREELERIEDALIESLMNASGDELREEFAAAGLDPDSFIAEVETTIASAIAECSQARLEQARAELLSWRNRDAKVNVTAIESAREKLERLRSGDKALDEKMMLAARKGEGLSDNDDDGLLEDLAALEEFESRKEDE